MQRSVVLPPRLVGHGGRSVYCRMEATVACSLAHASQCRPSEVKRMQLTDRNRAILLEFGIGVPINLALAAALYYWILPAPAAMDTAPSRVVFALQCSALPALSMLLGVWAVALSRATSDAINPLAGKESYTLQVHLRYLSNTAEQVLLFTLSAAALSTFLDPETIVLIPTLAVLFFLNRIVYWLGYLRDPMYRGVGLSGTIYPVSIMTVVAAYDVVQLLVAGGTP